jgi:periplasmic protein TonB
MTGGPIHRIDVAGPRAQGAAGDLSDVVPLAEREPASSAPPIAATNVIPFVRPRRDALPAGSAADITFDPAARPAPLLIARERRIQIAGLLALSVGVHAGLYMLFNRDPEPMASIGLEAISVEIMLGANMPAGPAPAPAQQVQSAPVEKPKPIDADATAKVEETKPAEATPVQEPQRLAQSPVTEAAPERPRPQAAETPPERQEQQQVAALPAEETPAPREPELTVAPQEPTKAAPAEPDRPEPVKTETQQSPQPKAAPKSQPKQKDARPAPSPKTASREPAPTSTRPPSVAGGVGAGRSQLDSNYRGIVFAHLARQKRYPAEAQSRGAQGRAMVNFSLDGSGRVTRVSLVNGTGHAPLDQEATAMVRRASPFPAPPDGRPLNFTAPISWRAQ